jgi:hypothetical protein
VKSRFVLVLVLLALALAAAPPAAPAPRADADAVKALINRQTSLFNARQWKALWATYVPSFRSSCSYAQWVAQNKTIRTRFGRVSTTNISVRVSGRRALANYVVRAGTKVVARPKNDVYVKMGTRWLDQESC